MIDRYLIRYFLAVVDQGNFSRAAAHCNVSQPTLSVGIAKLERGVGHPLFVRSNQRVELTEAGSRFLTYARRIETAFTSALDALGTLSPDRHEHTLRLGILHSIPGAIIARAAQACRTDLPGPIELSFASERDLLGRITRGRLDAVLTIIRSTIHGFPTYPMIEERYAMVFPADHALSRRTTVRAEELGSEPMIVRRHCEILSQTSRHFLDRGVRPHFSLRTTNDERVLDLVRAGVGTTVMPDSYRSEGVRHVRLLDFEYRRVLGVYVADAAVAGHPLLRAIERILRQDAEA